MCWSVCAENCKICLWQRNYSVTHFVSQSICNLQTYSAKLRVEQIILKFYNRRRIYSFLMSDMKKSYNAFRNLISKSDYINFVPPSPPNFIFILHPCMRYVWKKEIICWPILCIQSLFLYFLAWKLHFQFLIHFWEFLFLSFHLLVYFFTLPLYLHT